MPSYISDAETFATRAHGEQRRKYTGELYIVHPRNVAATVATVTDDEEVIAAAWLHDVVEDTNVTIDDVFFSFDRRITELVMAVTNPHVPGNRAARKSYICTRLAEQCAEAQTIKMADMLDNVPSIVQYAEYGFARLYVDEKWELYNNLLRADLTLRNRVFAMLEKAELDLTKH